MLKYSHGRLLTKALVASVVLNALMIVAGLSGGAQGRTTLWTRFSDVVAAGLLDGEHQIANVVHIATTNYPEVLGARIVNRPSRFDEVIKIGMPSASARHRYLEASLNATTLDHLEPPLDQWVGDTAGMSIAHLRELVVAIECIRKSKVRDLVDLGEPEQVKQDQSCPKDRRCFQTFLAPKMPNLKRWLGRGWDGVVEHPENGEFRMKTVTKVGVALSAAFTAALQSPAVMQYLVALVHNHPHIIHSY